MPLYVDAVFVSLNITFFEQVFPDLRAWCESRRLYLVECDLRWVCAVI